jgi:hypothetical protein
MSWCRPDRPAGERGFDVIVGRAAMTTTTVLEATWEKLSVTDTVTEKLPDSVGVPLTSPVEELSVSPPAGCRR